MNINIRPLAMIVGSIAGILSIFTLRHPLISLFIAVAATFITDGVLRLQVKS